MADSLQLRLEGVAELQRTLKGLPEKIRRRAVRNALRIAAREIRDDAKSRTPVAAGPVIAGGKTVRQPGTVKRRIAVRISKFARQAGDEGVFVGVRPLRGRAQVKRFGKASATNPNDPFYWRFLEFGTRKMGARPFLGPAAKAKGEAAVRRFIAVAGPQIQKLNVKGGG